MKKLLKKLPLVIITLLIIIAFSISVTDSTVFARGGGTSTRSTPKSGAKSGSFTNTKPSSTIKTNPISGSTKNNISSGSSWHMPTVVFWPHRTSYYDSYGVSHYGYARPSFLGGLIDVIIFLAIIAFVIWIIKKRR